MSRGKAPQILTLPLGVVVLLVVECHSFATQHCAQQIINNDFSAAQLALSLAINQMALLRILNESSTCPLHENQLQKTLELEVKTGELRNELERMEETAMSEFQNLTTAKLNETNKMQEEATRDLLELKETTIDELNTMKTAILNELQQRGTEGRKTYRKYDFNTTQPQALEACQQLGGRLALPTNKEEDDQISREIGVSFASDAWWEEAYWISGTDEQEEGVWIDNVTGERLNYTNFKSGQPDNHKNLDPAGEHCIQEGPRYSGWNDISCRRPGTGYVCEFTD